jgi:hypothetical protein
MDDLFGSDDGDGAAAKAADPSSTTPDAIKSQLDAAHK